MTRQQLKRFVKMRNTSEFQSNLQFQIDADTCGFRISDLGEVKNVAEGEYVWTTPHGILRERYGVMTLETENASAAQS